MQRFAATMIVTLALGALGHGEAPSALQAYAGLDTPRALAVAGDGRLAYGLGYGTRGDLDAARMALAACEAARKRYAMTLPCEITRLNGWQLTPGAALRRQHAGGALPLWRVRRGDRQMFVAGSIHMLKATLHPLDRNWETALAASQALVVEIDPASVAVPAAQARLARMTRLADGRTLHDVLPAGIAAELASYLARQGIPPDALAGATPLWVATQIQLATFDALGYRPEYGLEAHVLPLARRRGIPVVELESVDEQLQALLGYDLPVQVAVLHDTLDALNEAPQLIEALIGAWLRGDAEEFMTLFEAQSGDSPAARAYAPRPPAARRRPGHG